MWTSYKKVHELTVLALSGDIYYHIIKNITVNKE